MCHSTYKFDSTSVVDISILDSEFFRLGFIVIDWREKKEKQSTNYSNLDMVTKHMEAIVKTIKTYVNGWKRLPTG